MSKGELITSDYVVGLMEQYMENSEKNVFLADGFPRSQENLDVWNNKMANKVDVKFLLLFNLDGETMLKRLLYRASQSEVKRDDDNEDTMKKRIATFEKSLPIFDVFNKAGQLRKVDATGGIDEIFKNVEDAFTNEFIINKPKVIFVMGGPGAGKGTQCGRLLKKYQNLDSFSCGDLLRAKAKEDTDQGRSLSKDMSEGKLVSSETTVGLMDEYIARSSKNVFLADGFPRNQENINVWKSKMGHKVDFQFLLWFDLAGDQMLKRLLYRASQSKVKRSDDKEEVMLKRIATFNKSIPIFKIYKKCGWLRRVDANGDIDKIFGKVERVFVNEGLVKQKSKPKVVFVMGGPGAGKGTQCGRLLAKYPELDSFSTGDLLRNKVKEDTEEARQLKEHMNAGKLVSSETVVSLMEDYMNKSQKGVFLADGFPRNQENIDVWKAKLSDKTDVRFLLLFDLDEKVMLERLLSRAQNAEVKREDDKEEVMKKRIATFTSSLPIFDQFDKEDKLKKVDAKGDIDEIFASVEEVFANENLINVQ